MRPALIAFCAALAVRLGALSLYGPPPAPAADALEYHDYALSVVHAHAYRLPGGDLAGRAPGYPVFLAAVYAVAGDSTLSAALAQALLGALACALLARAAAASLGTAWGLAAGSAAAVYGGLVGPARTLLSEPLYSAALAALAWAVLDEEGPPLRRAAVLGAAAGAAAVTRPEALALCGFLLLVSPWGLARFRARDAALALALMTAPVGAWTARNAVVLGRPLPTTSRGGSNLYQGLQLALLRVAPARVAPFAPPPAAGELERDRAASAEFHRLWAAASWGERLKAYAFDFATLFYPFLPAYDWTFVVLLPLWLYGLALAARRRGWGVLAGYVAASVVLYTAFGGPVSRYREGFSPLLVLLSALAGREAAARWGGRRTTAAFSGWAALNLFVWLAAPHARAWALRLRDLFV